MNRDQIESALRDLVKAVWEGCHGAYGGTYEGDCELEIQKVATAITGQKQSQEELHGD